LALLPQHPHPAPCLDESRFARARLPVNALLPCLPLTIIAGTLSAARGAAAPQPGQGVGIAYSAIGRKSSNRPQRAQSYSYFGILFLSFFGLCDQADKRGAVRNAVGIRFGEFSG
jgi:hypothetical protein